METTKNGERIGVYLDKELLLKCDTALSAANARSRSEFIRNALEYYLAYLQSKDTSRVLTPALESVIGGKIAVTEDRISRMIFKLTVEVAMMNHLYASSYYTDPDYLEELRALCTEEVAQLNGQFRLDEIADRYRESR